MGTGRQFAWGVVLALAGATGGYAFARARADAAPVPAGAGGSLAVIDVARIKEHWGAWQETEREGQASQQGLQEEIQANRRQVEQRQEEIQRRLEVLDPSGAEWRRERGRQEDLQREHEEFRERRMRQWQGVQGRRVQAAGRVIREATARVARGRGVGFVLDREMAWYADAALDLTDEVLRELPDAIPEASAE